MTVSVIVLESPGTVGILDVLDAPDTVPLETIFVGSTEPHSSRPAGRTTWIRAQGSRATRWNAGVRAARGDAIALLDAGERLQSSAVKQALTWLEEDHNLSFVSCGVRVEDRERRGFTLLPETPELSTLVGRPQAIPTAVIRRSVWEEAKGFDESLTAFEDYEFWLRLLKRGAQGRCLDAPLVVSPAQEGSPYRRRFDGERRLESLHAIFDKHADIFEADPSAVLCGLEEFLASLSDRHTALERRRESLLSEAKALDHEIASLEQELKQLGAADRVEMGDLRRTSPIGRNWGYERGKPVDRYYIEQFLEAHAKDIQGVVLEVQENDYTTRFGGDRVARSDVVDIDRENKRATIVADLRRAKSIPDGTYDCFMLCQTLHVIDDQRAVLAECVRILKPGGVLLITLPCASRVCLEYGKDGDFWRYTEAGARRLFEEFFPREELEIQSYGNVLVTTAFLYGLASHEVGEREFETHDPFYPLIVGVRAVKPASDRRSQNLAQGSKNRWLSTSAPRPRGAAILLYHRVTDLVSDIHGLAVHPSDFRDHMELLLEEFEPTSLADLAQNVGEGRTPKGNVAITFDDGYLDNLVQASSVLSDLQIPATFFLSTEHMDAPGEYWWDVLERGLLTKRAVPDQLEIDLGGKVQVLMTATSEDRMKTYWLLYRVLIASSLQERERLIRDFKSWARSALSSVSSRPLLREEIRRLAARSGHEIGGHGRHHLALSSQPRAVQRSEIEGCRESLEEVLQRKVTVFAYPFGDWSPEVATLARQTGIQIAVTCEEAAVRPGLDPLLLPRMEVKPGGAGMLRDRLHRLLGG